MNATIADHTGFVGNLSAEQEKKLQQLWALVLRSLDVADTVEHVDDVATRAPPLVSSNMEGLREQEPEIVRRMLRDVAPDDLRDSWLHMLKQEDPDALLLRFLRARTWDVSHAFAMLVGAIVWRCKEACVDEEICPKGEPWCAGKLRGGNDKERRDAREFLDQQRSGKVYLHGQDRAGRPVGYIHLALHRPGEQSEQTVEKLVVHTIETARCLFEAPVESFCIVFDLTGFSVSNMEWNPAKFIIRNFEANYPECLGVMLIHNAPWIFSGIWRVIRGLLDPVVASKVHFTRGVEDLERWVPRENIIKCVGGPENWSYKFKEPSEEENADIANAEARTKIMGERRKIAGDLLKTTRGWLKHAAAGEPEQAAAQQARRKEAIEKLRVNYWKLDPHVRSRTQLDRTGVIKPGGVIDHYPERKKTTTTGTSHELALDHESLEGPVREEVTITG